MPDRFGRAFPREVGIQTASLAHAGFAVLVPVGTSHNFTHTGGVRVKLHARCAPPVTATASSTARALTEIGEASARISPELRERHPEAAPEGESIASGPSSAPPCRN